MRNFSLGLILALTLIVSSPAAAVGGAPSIALPTFDLWPLILEALDHLKVEPTASELGPEHGPNGQEKLVGEESEPELEPAGGDEPPTSEMGPIYDPLG